MVKYRIKLVPFRKDGLEIPLEVEHYDFFSIDKDIDFKKNIYADLSYEISLLSDELDIISDAQIFINDILLDSIYLNGQFMFQGDYLKSRIFIDTYGFVQLKVVLYFFDADSIELTSKYLPVLVRKGKENDSIRKMAQEVYNNQHLLFFTEGLVSRDVAGIKDEGLKSIESQIKIAIETLETYERNYGYFKANSRFCIKRQDVIERTEKLEYVTPKTLEYICTHPEELVTSNNAYGMRIGTSHYYPRRTLTSQNVYSRDIYENRVIVWFLLTIINDLNKLKQEIISTIENIPGGEFVDEEYCFSATFIFSYTKTTLENNFSIVDDLIAKYVEIKKRYSDIFKFDTNEVLVGMPKITPVFLNIQQYNQIFLQIYQWNNYGLYNLSHEKIMLSFMKVSTLYECYLLCRMIDYFYNRGFSAISHQKYNYPIRESWKYVNSKFDNTFKMAKDNKLITIYYQPVIFDTPKMCNGIGIYRNNSISLSRDNEERRGHYYVPDFLLKIETENGVHYMICDAKYSTKKTVRHRYVPELSYKYIFSLSAFEAESYIDGLCVFYGKNTENDEFDTIYDKQIEGKNIMPFADLFPCSASVNDEKYFENFDCLMSKVYMI